VTGDLSQKETAKQLIDDVLNRFGRIDILINNAGTIRRSPAVDYSEDDWATVIEVNLSSVFRLSQLAGRSMIDSDRGGKIVNIASLLSFQGGITVPAYAASKGGVAQLTKALKLSSIATSVALVLTGAAYSQDPSDELQTLTSG
jgi:2-deoxy-D-gluconate 3-dehydrogenase